VEDVYIHNAKISDLPTYMYLYTWIHRAHLRGGGGRIHT